jgi:hypothetical protein
MRTPGRTEPVIEEFSTHLALGDEAGMLMVEQRHGPLDCTIWIRLPDKVQAARYPGFQEAPEGQLPRKATLVFGKNDEFEKLFGHGSEG